MCVEDAFLGLIVLVASCRHLLDRTCANFVREHVHFRENHDENHVPESCLGWTGGGLGGGGVCYVDTRK